MSRRLFISIDIEDEETIKALKKFQDQVSGLGLTRPSSPENFHITLNFIGEVSEDRLEPLVQDLRQVRFSSFEFMVKGVGVFPELDFIKVVWAGIGKGSPSMSSLSSNIRDSIDQDLVQEREFHPHVTLLRVKNIGREDKDELQELVNEGEERLFGVQKAERFYLKESVLKSEGARHETIEEFDLK